MKKLFPAILIALGVWFFACENPFKDVVFQFKDPLTKATVALQYYNANQASKEKSPKGLTIKLVGPDAGRIRNLTGGTLIKPSQEGLLGLAVDPNELPTANDPVTVSVLSDAPGYYSRLSNYTLTNDGKIGQWIPLFSPTDLPAGVTAVQEDVKSSDDLTLSTTGSVSARCQLPKGTALRAADNAAASGETRISLYTFTGGVATSFLPGYTQSIYNAVDRNNNKLSPFLFQGYAFVQLEAFTTNGQILTGAGSPLPLTVVIPDGMRHPDGTSLKEGELIPFWGYDPVQKRWEQLADQKLQKNSQGKLSFSTQIATLSFYALADTQPICENGPTFKFNTDISGVDINYYGRLIDATTGQVVYETFLNLNNGASRNFSGMIRRTVRLQVFKANDYYGGDRTTPIYQSEPVDLCDAKTIVATIKFTTPPPKVSVELNIKCPAGKQVDENLLPAQLFVQYKFSGTNNWVDLITMTREVRKVASNRLELGKRYAFRATPNPAVGWPFVQSDTTLKQTFFKLDIEYDGFCR